MIAEGKEVVEYTREFVAIHENSNANIIFQTKGVKKEKLE